MDTNVRFSATAADELNVSYNELECVLHSRAVEIARKRVTASDSSLGPEKTAADIDILVQKQDVSQALKDILLGACGTKTEIESYSGV